MSLIRRLKKDSTTKAMQVDEYICPVCTDHMTPPIRQCINNHRLCRNCFRRLSRCPVCREPKTLICRDILKLQPDMPCRYSSQGCCFSSAGVSLVLHEMKCLYLPKLCPVSYQEGCYWTGALLHIGNHCKIEHPGAVHFSEEAVIVIPGFIDDHESRSYTSVFFVYNLIFFCYWDVNVSTSRVTFTVTYAGIPFRRHKFAYKIGLLDGSSMRSAITLRGSCAFSENGSPFGQEKSCESTSYEFIRSLCTEDGSFRYCVNIIENNLEKCIETEILEMPLEVYSRN